MFVPQSNACTVTNSETPITPAQVSAAIAAKADYEATIQNAQQAFESIINRPDMGPVVNNPLSSYRLQAMARTAGGGSAAPSGTAASDSGSAPQRSSGARARRQTPQYCVLKSITSQTLQGTPDPHPMPPLTTAPLTGFKPPTTGNVCLDIQNGYLQQSQVSPAQLADCSKKGYYQIPSSMLNNPTLMAAMQKYWAQMGANLPHVPDQPNVPDFNSIVESIKQSNPGISDQAAIATAVRGMSGYRGMGDFSWGAAAIAGGLTFGLLMMLGGKKRR